MSYATNLPDGVISPILTTVERDAIASPQAGALIFNSDLTVPQVYDGTSWITTKSVSYFAEPTAAPATAPNSTATAAIAIGDGANATGTNAIAFGETANASNTNTIAIGRSTIANTSGAMALGDNTTASASNATAVGFGSSASAANAVSLGVSVANGVTNSVGIGYNDANKILYKDVGGVAYLGTNGSVPDSGIHHLGSVALNQTIYSVDSTTTDTDYIILADPAGNGGTITITLKDVTVVPFRIYVVKQTSAGVVTVQDEFGSNIDGASTYVMSTIYDKATFASSGSSWHVIA